MKHAALARTAATLALLAAGPVTAESPGFYQRDDVRMFERAELGREVWVTAFGIRRDTRCTERSMCLRDDRLIVAVVVSHHGREREMLLELGQPVEFGDGRLTLVSTATPPSDAGAIALKSYRLDLRWQPD